MSLTMASTSPTEKENEKVDIESNTPSKLANAPEALRFLQASISSAGGEDDWKEIEKDLFVIRSLALYHSDLLVENPPDKLFRFLRLQANSLRSAITRAALAALEDVFLCCPSLIKLELDGDFSLEDTVSLLVLRSVNEKKFIADAARKALDALARARKSGEASEAILMKLLENAKNSKSVRLTAVACSAALLCAESMPSSDLASYLKPEKVLPLVLEIEGGKSTDARPAAQKLIRLVYGAADISIRDSIPLPDVLLRRLDEITKTGAAKSDKNSSRDKPWLLAKAKSSSTEPST